MQCPYNHKSNMTTTLDDRQQQSRDGETAALPQTAQQKLETVWNTLLEKQQEADPKREWPSYDTVLSDTLSTDYNQILKCPFDFLHRNNNSEDKDNTHRHKVLGPHGVVCQARLELFPNNNSNNDYTGALQPGTTWHHCLLRLSSAMQPPNQVASSSLAKSLLYATGNKLRNAQLFPMAALKVFVDDDENDNNSNNNTTIIRPSRNLLVGGSKIGQRETDYFAHCQCTSMTERMPLAVKPFVRTFYQYSNYPLSLGVSDFCRPMNDNDTTTGHDSNNNNNEKTSSDKELLNFPFAIILKPRITSSPCSSCNDDEDGGSSDGDSDNGETKESITRRCSEIENTNNTTAADSAPTKKSWSKWASFSSFSRGSSTSNSDDTTTKSTALEETTTTTGSFDQFLDFCLHDIPAETHLYDVYACPTPQAVADPSQLQRIGRIVSTSAFLTSSPNDGLFFKHQAKEEDYALRPDWPEALQQPITALDEGKVKGTVGQLAGWKLFQQQIAKKQYIDFEQSTITNNQSG